MAHIMTKRGNLDNIITYQHICDTTADLSNISQEYRTLGSIAIVIEGEGGGLEVYITNSNKQWILLSMSNNSNSDIPITTNLLHILTANEYDTTTHIPTIVHPEENVIYLVPSTNQENTNLFDEWIYTGNSWEKFSSTSIAANIQPDWEQNDENATDYIKNRICYTDDLIEEVLIDTVCEKRNIQGDIYSLQANSSSQISFDYNENDIFEFSYAGQVYYRGTLQFYETYYSYYFSNSQQYENYQIDLVENFFSIYSNRPSPDSGRFIVKHISQNIEKLDPKYLPVNIRAGTNKGIIEGMITKNIASGEYSHAQGHQTTASQNYSHAQGDNTTASGDDSHAQGYLTVASGNDSHAEGSGTLASGPSSHAQGHSTIANHVDQHVFGRFNIADNSPKNASQTGTYIEIVGNGSDTNNRSNARTLDWSGNEQLAGGITLAGNISRGRKASTTIGDGSFAFGVEVTASGTYSHAESSSTTASGVCSHAEGGGTTASGICSHAEGAAAVASGDYSHAEGRSTIANHESQHVFGQYNIADPSVSSSDERGAYIEIVGNGTVDQQSNARTLDWNGNETLKGTLTTSSNGVTIGNTTLTEVQLQALLALLE